VVDIFYTFNRDDHVLRVLLKFVSSENLDSSYITLLHAAMIDSRTPNRVVLKLPQGSDRLKAINTFNDCFQQITSNAPETDAYGEWESLANGLIHLISRDVSSTKHVTNIQDDAKANGLNESEFLIIAEGDHDKIVRQYRQLTLRKDSPTQVRLATTRGNNGNNYVLFWVKDDETRQSLYQGLRIQNIVTGIETQAYDVKIPNIDHTFRFFFPLLTDDESTIRPTKDRLSLLSEFMLATPSLFGATGTPNLSDIQVIGAVYTPLADHDEQTQPEVLFLPDVVFLSDTKLLEQQDREQFQIVAMINDNLTMQRVLQDIKENTSFNGYQIELRQAKYSFHMTEHQRQVEFNRLKSERAQINDRLAQLAGFAKIRPILLRFPIADTASLMNCLAGYRPQELNQIGYFFYEGEATEREETSYAYHYLYVPPAVDRQLSNTLIAAGNESKNNPVAFWIEPYWAGAYQDNCTSQVFVPYGRRLSPALHSWDVGDMDAYLRQRFQHVLPHQSEQPMYIFHELMDDLNNGQIVVHSMDQSQFQPVNHAMTIKWFNDNLIMLNYLDAMKKDIVTIANQARRKEFADLATANATDAMLEARDAGHEAQEEMSKQTDDLMQAVEDDLNANIDVANQQIKQSKDLQERLEGVQALYETTERRVTRIDHQLVEARKLINTVTDRISTLKDDVEKKLQESKSVEREQTRIVSAEIDNLKQSYSTLVRKIRELEEYL
jgi:hypothetical protein